MNLTQNSYFGACHAHIFSQTTVSEFLKVRHFGRHFQRFISLEHVTRANKTQSFPPELTKALVQSARHTPEQLYQELNTSLAGLDQNQVEQRQQQYGLNEIQQEKPLSWWVHLWFCYRNPFSLLLTLLALVSFLPMTCRVRW
jgi:Mg2+-importing ATPase